jgi:2-methylfumaryl-CoA isomerase
VTLTEIPPLTGILDGVRVVELSAFVAVPLAGATLASLGADVIRIDPIGGGLDIGRFPKVNETSLYWSGLNQGKRSVTLNLRSQRGRDLVRQIVAGGGPSGGIIITNLGSREWASYERLKELRPDLLMVVLSGNHDGSPAVDYTVNARIGYPLVTGPPNDEDPVNHALPAWDAMAGYMTAIAVLAGELHRARTGQGQLVRLSLMDVALATASRLGLLAEAQLVAEERGRFGNFVYGTFGKDFTTADGRDVMVVAMTARQWRGIVDATGLAGRMAALEAGTGTRFDDEAARWEARESIADLIAEWTSRHTLAELADLFDRHHVLWSPYQSFKQLASEDPDCSLANPLFTRVDHASVGDYLLAGSPLNFGAVTHRPSDPPPRLGEHTIEVMHDVLGLSDLQIAELQRDGILAA